MVSNATALGWFNLAVSYRKAARHLASGEVGSTHPEMPVRFNYYHAIELLLKSFLVLHGYDEDRLRSIGHRVKNLAAEAAGKGLHFDDEDEDVIDLMAEGSTVIDARYLRVGAFQWPALEALERTAESLVDSVGSALRDAGHPVRR
jgi:HEPN domain-containing protein